MSESGARMAGHASPRLLVLVAGHPLGPGGWVARSLERMGASLLSGVGDETTTAAGRADDAVLRFFLANGLDPNAPLAAPGDCFKGKAAADCRADLAAILDGAFGGSNVLAVSLAHLDRALPLWLAAADSLQVGVRLVIPVVHPLEWGPWNKRPGADAQAWAQWLVSMLAVERVSRPLVRHFVGVDALLADPGGEMSRLCDKLSCFAQGRAASAKADIDTLWRELSLHYGRPRPQDQELPEWILRAYGWLRQAARGEGEPGPGPLDETADDLSRAACLFDPWLMRRDDSGIVGELRQRLQAAEEQARLLRHENAILKQGLAQDGERQGALAAELAQAQAQASQRLAELAQQAQTDRESQNRALAALAALVLAPRQDALPPVQRLGGLARALLRGRLRARLREDRDVALIAASGSFDRAFYCKRYPDIAGRGVDPIVHYVRNGAREGRFPHPDFDSRYYLNAYPDVAAAGANPLAHYLRHGAAEGRRTHHGDEPGRYAGLGIDKLLAKRLFGDAVNPARNGRNRA